ncbi:hypothetical protein ACHWQZ_G014237 [Mnemiopsis leidyi]
MTTDIRMTIQCVFFMVVLLLGLLVQTTEAAEATEPYKEAEHATEVNFTTSCNLKVLSTSTTSENSWDGDVSFLAGEKEVLLIGLHPESKELAVRNDLFKRGDNRWGFWWVKVDYPDLDGKFRREYIFSFNVTKQALVLTCGGDVSTQKMIEIPFTELTDNVNEFLNSISKVFFHQKGDEESQLDRNRIEYSKICSITGQCSDFNTAWEHVIRDVTQSIQHNQLVQIECKQRFVNLGGKTSTCKDGTLFPDPYCVKTGKGLKSS